LQAAAAIGGKTWVGQVGREVEVHTLQHSNRSEHSSFPGSQRLDYI
jgi:hypothetical protein